MSWEDIARQVCQERDSDKVTELANDLIKALDSEAEASNPKSHHSPTSASTQNPS
jgi:hypothetical protein